MNQCHLTCENICHWFTLLVTFSTMAPILQVWLCLVTWVFVSWGKEPVIRLGVEERGPSVKRGWTHCKRESTALTPFFCFVFRFLGKSTIEHREFGKCPQKIAQDSKWDVPSGNTFGMCSWNPWHRWTWEPLETQNPDLLRQNLQWAKFKSWRKHWASSSLPGLDSVHRFLPGKQPFARLLHIYLPLSRESPGAVSSSPWDWLQWPFWLYTPFQGCLWQARWSLGKCWLIALIRFGREILFLRVLLEPGILN